MPKASISQNFPRSPDYFTEEMRDRQARNKDPYTSSDDGDDYMFELEHTSGFVYVPTISRPYYSIVAPSNPERYDTKLK